VHVGVLEVLDVAHQRDPGVVADDVDPAERIGDRGGVRREGAAVGDVERVATHLPRAGSAHQVDGLRQPALVHVGDRDAGTTATDVDRVCAGARAGGTTAADVDGQGAADPGRRTGDHDDLVVQRLHGSGHRLAVGFG